MTRVTSVSASTHPKPRKRLGVAAGALFLGVPLGLLLVFLLNPSGPLQTPAVSHYIEHPVEWVEVVMCCVALGGLAFKLWGTLTERGAFGAGLLAGGDGKPVPVEQAAVLLDALERRPARSRDTFLGRRIAAVLEFVRDRRSATELDDQLRTLADADAIALEGSYALIRFITWAIPILGFLGTVLGITQSISGLDPGSLDKDLGKVTGGLAQAFDATALGLGLTMIVMFLTYVVDRVEQGVVQAVDQFADRHLAHRFERPSSAANEVVDAARRSTEVLTDGVERLVEKQAVVWARALEEVNTRRAVGDREAQQQMTAGLEQALERTLAAHEKRLTQVEQQAAAQTTQLIERLASLGKLAEVLARQAETLARLQEGERHLIRLQEDLERNLDALTGAGAFQQAVHSLTAAIHLLTLHAAPTGGRAEGHRRPGAAA
jgi:hypothetical protein